jgi:hypothetical protein
MNIYATLRQITYSCPAEKKPVFKIKQVGYLGTSLEEQFLRR